MNTLIYRGRDWEETLRANDKRRAETVSPAENLFIRASSGIGCTLINLLIRVQSSGTLKDTENRDHSPCVQEDKQGLWDCVRAFLGEWVVVSWLKGTVAIC